MSRTEQYLADSIFYLADVLAGRLAPATKQDLDNLEQRLSMKLSQIKDEVKAAAAASVEAKEEILAHVALIEQQLADAIAGATDPDVTEEAFLADLATLSANVSILKDVVKNEPEPPAPTPEVVPPVA